MSLDRNKKEEIVNEFREKLQGAQLVVRLGFSGLTVERTNTVRRALEKVDGTYLAVVKNTLADIASRDSASSPLFQKATGPNAFLVVGEEFVAAAKVLVKYAKDFDKFEVKDGILGGKLITADQVKALATMPGKNELRAQLLAVFKAPTTQLVGVLAAVPRNVLNVLNARKTNLEQAA